jgi:hypothetical protein
MKSSFAVIAPALLAIAMPAAAADGFMLSAGFDYSTGKYGGTESTDILYLPLVAKYESGPLIIKLTVPYVEITRPAATTVAVIDEEPVIVSTTSGASSASRVSGLGDSVVAATYNLYFDSAAGLLFDATAKAKFATGDASQGLGTGKDDYAFQVDAYKTIGQLSLLGTAGYKWMGKPDGSNYRNVPYASAGLAYKFSSENTAGLIADYRRSVLPDTTSQRELTLYLAHHIDRNWKLQAYAVAGMSSSSPDAGAGAMVGYVF